MFFVVVVVCQFRCFNVKTVCRFYGQFFSENWPNLSKIGAWLIAKYLSQKIVRVKIQCKLNYKPSDNKHFAISRRINPQFL